MTSAAPFVLSWIVVFASLFAVLRSRDRARAMKGATVFEGRLATDGDQPLSVAIHWDRSSGREISRSTTVPAFAIVQRDGTRVAVRVEATGEQLVLRTPLRPPVVPVDDASVATHDAEIENGEHVVVEALTGPPSEHAYRGSWWPSTTGRVVVSRPRERAKEQLWLTLAFVLVACGFASMLAIPWWLTRDWERANAFAAFGVTYFVAVGGALRSTRPWWLGSVG